MDSNCLHQASPCRISLQYASLATVLNEYLEYCTFNCSSKGQNQLFSQQQCIKVSGDVPWLQPLVSAVGVAFYYLDMTKVLWVALLASQSG
jgi:hypothetical protein